MTVVIRKTIEYTPTRKEVVLSSQKEINNAVVPYVADSSSNEKQLAFLMNSETFSLAQEVHIPPDLTNEQVNQLADLIIKRQQRPFLFTEIDSESLWRIMIVAKEKAGNQIVFPSYKFDITRYNMHTDIRVQDYVRYLRIDGGSLLNIPTMLEFLDVRYTNMSPEVMIQIGKAQHLTEILIEDDHINGNGFRGLPFRLEKLDVTFDIDFEPNYNYDCPFLKTLNLTTINKLPIQLIRSISESLVSLTIGSDESVGLKAFLNEMFALEELIVFESSFDVSVVPPDLPSLDLQDGYVISEPGSYFPRLRKLELSTSTPIDDFLERTPELRELIVDFRRDTYLAEGIYPQVRVLELSSTKDNSQISDIRRTFPRLETYTKLVYDDNNRHEVWDFKNDSVTINVFAVGDGFSLLDEGRIIKKFVFDYDKPKIYYVKDRQDSFTIELPTDTEEVSFIIKGLAHKRSIQQIRDILGVVVPIKGLVYKSDPNAIELVFDFGSIRHEQPIWFHMK
jgi:hypothetical protein